MNAHRAPGGRKTRSPSALGKNVAAVKAEAARMLGGRKISHDAEVKLHVLLLNKRRPGLSIEQRREIEAEIAGLLAQAFKQK